MNGATRPFFGWVSDNIGRENTMFIAFGAEGLAILLLLKLAHIPVMFVILSGLVFFAWGEIYSLFPAIAGDLFGQKFCHHELRCAVHGQGHRLPAGAHRQHRGGVHQELGADLCPGVAFDFTAALLALFVLKPLRARVVARARRMAPAPAGGGG